MPHARNTSLHHLLATAALSWALGYACGRHGGHAAADAPAPPRRLTEDGTAAGCYLERVLGVDERIAEELRRESKFSATAYNGTLTKRRAGSWWVEVYIRLHLLMFEAHLLPLVVHRGRPGKMPVQCAGAPCHRNINDQIDGWGRPTPFLGGKHEFLAAFGIQRAPYIGNDATCYGS